MALSSNRASRALNRSPGAAQRAVSRRIVRFPPREGVMLIFPNWLYHHVTPFRGAGERISISCNIPHKFSES